MENKYEMKYSNSYESLEILPKSKIHDLVNMLETKIAEDDILMFIDNLGIIIGCVYKQN